MTRLPHWTIAIATCSRCDIALSAATGPAAKAVRGLPVSRDSRVLGLTPQLPRVLCMYIHTCVLLYLACCMPVSPTEGDLRGVDMPCHCLELPKLTSALKVRAPNWALARACMAVSLTLALQVSQPDFSAACMHHLFSWKLFAHLFCTGSAKTWPRPGLLAALRSGQEHTFQGQGSGSISSVLGGAWGLFVEFTHPL